MVQRRHNGGINPPPLGMRVLDGRDDEAAFDYTNFFASRAAHKAGANTGYGNRSGSGLAETGV